MKRLILITMLGTASVSHAGMYKCTDHGKVSYQEMPCASGATSASIKISAQPAISSESDNEAQKKKLADTRKKLSQAVKDRLAAGDIAGAYAIATTPDDFALVKAAEERQRKIAHEKAMECGKKYAELERMKKNADQHPNDSWWKNLADAEQNKYNIDCL